MRRKVKKDYILESQEEGKARCRLSNHFCPKMVIFCLCLPLIVAINAESTYSIALCWYVKHGVIHSVGVNIHK